MTLTEIDSWLKALLRIEEYPSDPSLNGIQIANDAPEHTQVSKAAFAVDACLETMRRAANASAGLLFVHHGIFWGHEQALAGTHYERAACCIKHNLALYACHIPLDAHETVGNNACLAKRLDLENVKPFGLWRAMTIGVQGKFKQPETLDSIVRKLFPGGEQPRTILPFGKQQISTAGIISGGAGDDIDQAAAAGLDVFITGEISHECYHFALENHINVIAGGHYQTETAGVRAVMEKFARETNTETVFIDVPTGL
ncbi:MAG: Nif3-like dinuclear metal center hexameric protein [Bacteroides sp.]|nr:Nif3-like dinuclear metal center hexameric protein [Prevotella sp.]MCM1408611.1 Nif3-like dinuclear metal center hexameric protein [Treponema brennaborense]MCM1468901.1 Nif3-like dinuclear metal center hexameric protein [Bacteroides sp.]